MSDQKRGILIVIVSILFIVSTVYLNFFSSPKQAKKSSPDLLSVFTPNNSKQTGLNDIPEGETVPNWKKAVLAQAEKDDPNGLLRKASSTDSVDTTNLDDPNNITSQYAKNVYTATAVISQNTEITPTQKAEIAKSILAEELKKASAPVYTIKDLKTIASTPAAVKLYGNTLGALFIYALEKVITYDDMAMIKEYGQTGDVKTLTKYDEKIETLGGLRDAILYMSVPNSAIVYHLQLVNALAMYHQTLINMRGIIDDPVRATAGASDYTVVYKGFFVAIDSFKEYFALQHTTFTAKEPGSFMSNGIIK
jgi:hypothetical protein